MPNPYDDEEELVIPDNLGGGGPAPEVVSPIAPLGTGFALGFSAEPATPDTALYTASMKTRLESPAIPTINIQTDGTLADQIAALEAIHKSEMSSAKTLRVYHIGRADDPYAIITHSSHRDHPLVGRVSAVGSRHGSTRSNEWSWINSIGWRYEGDAPTFGHKYAWDDVSERWMMRQNCVGIVKKGAGYDEIQHTNFANINKLDLVQCATTPILIYRSDGIEVFGHNGEKSYVRKGSTHETKIVQCPDKGVKCLGPACRVHGFPYEFVSHYAINSDGGSKYMKCPECAHVWNRQALAEYNGGIYCPDCLVAVQSKGIIHPYNHSPRMLPMHDEISVLGFTIDAKDMRIYASGKRQKHADPHLFGVELETELHVPILQRKGKFRWDIAKEINDALGASFLYMKEDGTLTMNGKYGGPNADQFAANGDGKRYAGFEIVTCPASLNHHRKYWPKLHSVPNFNALRSWDAPTCGMHVHCNRAPITNLQLGKMLVFINSKKNRKFMREISGRGGNKYCVYEDKTFSDAIHPERVISSSEHEERDRRRRVALNLSHEGTVEFRGFKGTVNPRHIIRNIEFCDALIKFCYPCNHGIGSFNSHHEFVDFVEKNIKTWPLLAEWFVNQKYIKPRKVGPKADVDKLTIKPTDVPEAGVACFAEKE